MSTFKYVAIGVAALIAIPVGLNAIGVFNTVATAPGRVINKTLQTDNIIFNYERFFDVNANYTARVAQITEYKPVLAGETDPAEKSRLRTELSAMKQSCRELANGYNADAQKLNRSLFRDNKLPEQLDVTACE
jgi:hypothetical protein